MEMPYPLGRYKGLRPCLIGGIRGSLLYGTVKEQRQEHVLFIGPTGTGKTSAYFIPPLLLDKHAHMLRLGIRKRIFAAEIKVIPQPLQVVRVKRDGYRPLLKYGRKLH